MSNFFKKLKYRFFISSEIDDDEILIRVLTSPKHYNIERGGEFEKRKFKDFFLQYKGGVSIDRYKYIKEKRVKKKAKKIKGYIGFAFLKRGLVSETLSEYLSKFRVTDLEVGVEYSPLNSLNEPHKNLKYINIFSNGNPAHADINYFANSIKLEQPNTSIRNFSRLLAIKAIKSLDNDLNSKSWSGKKFVNYFKEEQYH